MSAALDTPPRGRGWVKGRPRSPQTRAKISAALVGRKPSAETRAKMSAAKAGKPLTAEHRAKVVTSLRQPTLEQRAKRAAMLAGVPVECLDAYRLYRRKGFSVAEARAAVQLNA